MQFKKDKFNGKLSNASSFSDIKQSIYDFSGLCWQRFREFNADNLMSRISLRYHSFSRRNPVNRYIRDFISTAIEAFLLIAAIYFLCVLLLYVMNMLWCFYLETVAGQQFLGQFPERAQTIKDILELNYWYFAAELTISSFVICLGICVIGNFFHINRHFYHSLNFLTKLLVWGLSTTGAVTYYFYSEYEFADWQVIFVTTSVPTGLMFMSCFKYAEKLLPELGDLIRAFKNMIKKLKVMIFSG